MAKAIKEAMLDAVDEEMKSERKAEREINQLIKKESEKGKKKEKTSKRVHPVPGEILHCRGIFFEEVLGSHPGSEQLFSDYVASKAPDAPTMRQEIEMYGQEDAEEIRTTKFPRDKDGDPCIIGYQLRGYMKSAARALKRSGWLTVAAHEKVITETVKFSATPCFNPIEKRIKLIPPRGESMYLCQRPLRGKTPQGETNSIASSEALPAGTSFEFYVQILDRDSKERRDEVLSWLEYGKYVGFGQWRTSGCGRFNVEIEEKGEWTPIEDVG